MHVDGVGSDLIRARYPVEFSLLLAEQLVPPIDGVLDELGDAERQCSHEIVARRSVPVPHFHRQPLRVVFRRQRTTILQRVILNGPKLDIGPLC